MSNKAVIGFNFGFVCVKKWHEFRANKIQEQEQITIHDCFWNRGSPGHTRFTCLISVRCSHWLPVDSLTWNKNGSFFFSKGLNKGQPRPTVLSESHVGTDSVEFSSQKKRNGISV